MKTELTRLRWKTDRERIQQTIEHLNNKYLIGLYEKLSGMPDTFSGYDDGVESTDVTVKYDGYIFSCSRKTLSKELVRRDLISQKDSSMSIHPDGTPRKCGTKRYKNIYRVEQCSGQITYEKRIKSGKELKKISTANSRNPEVKKN